jgi:hypothetical protein
MSSLRSSLDSAMQPLFSDAAWRDPYEMFRTVSDIVLISEGISEPPREESARRLVSKVRLIAHGDNNRPSKEIQALLLEIMQGKIFAKITQDLSAARRNGIISVLSDIIESQIKLTRKGVSILSGGDLIKKGSLPTQGGLPACIRLLGWGAYACRPEEDRENASFALEALRTNVIAAAFFPSKLTDSRRFAEAAVTVNGLALFFFGPHWRSPEVLLRATEQNWRALGIVPPEDRHRDAVCNAVYQNAAASVLVPPQLGGDQDAIAHLFLGVLTRLAIS